MAIIRMAASAGAALIALTAIVAAASQAQASRSTAAARAGARPGQETPRAPPRHKKAATDCRQDIRQGNENGGAQNDRAAEPAPAQPASKDGTEQFALAADRHHRRRADARPPSNAQRGSRRTGQRATAQPRAVLPPRVRCCAVRHAAAADHRAGPERHAPGQRHARPRFRFAGRHVALVAQRPHAGRPATEASQAESKVMAAAEVWLAARTAMSRRPTARPARPWRSRRRKRRSRSPMPDEVNEIDLAAESTPGTAGADFPAIAAGAVWARPWRRLLGAAPVRLVSRPFDRRRHGRACPDIRRRVAPLATRSRYKAGHDDVDGCGSVLERSLPPPPFHPRGFDVSRSKLVPGLRPL